MGSPLMLGCDLRTVRKGDEIHSLITNKDLIAINQDPAALQAFDVKYSWGNKDLRVIARLLDNGDTAIGFFNFDDKSPRSATVMLEDLGFPYESGMVLDLRDLFTGETFTSGRDEFVMRDVPSHGCRVFRATPRKVQ